MIARNVVPPQERIAGTIADSDASDEEHFDIEHGESDTENDEIPMSRFEIAHSKGIITKTMLEDLTNEAFDVFVSSDLDNILANVSERNLCSRLGFHMNHLLHKYGLTYYFIDSEYNRKQNDLIKTILDDNLEVVTINCDLILHSRGRSVQHDNLITIEMKKSNRPRKEKEKDRKRLRALTKDGFGDDIWSGDGKTHPEHVCNYQLGFYIELDISSRTFLFEQYERGRKQKEWKRQF